MKPLRASCAIIALVVLSAAVASGAIHYRLDESSGQTALDSRGTQNAATTSAAPGWRPGQGIIGGALEFTPTAQADVSQMFLAPLASAPSYPFTLSAWIKTTSTSNYNKTFLFFGDGTAGANYFSLLVSPAQRVQAGARNTTLFTAEYATNINDGVWHHVAGVYADPTTRTLYVDGVARATSANSVAAPNRNRFGLGALTRSAPTDAYIGWLDDVGLWDEALTPAKVALVHAFGRLSQLALSDAAITNVLSVYSAQSGFARAGAYVWTYATGLAGGQGTLGTNGVGKPFVVLGTAGQGVIGDLGAGLEVTLASPTNGAAFNPGTTIPLQANVITNFAAPQRVDFYTNNVLLGSSTNSPFVLTWPDAPPGNSTVFAVAVDTNGLSATSAVVTVSVRALAGVSVAIVSPTNGAIFNTNVPVTISAVVATNGAPLQSLQLFEGSDFLAALNPPFVYPISTLPLGDHSFTAIATDVNGLSSTSSVVTISVRVIAGVSVALTSPTNGAVFNFGVPILLQALVTTNTAAPERVDFYNGNTWLGSAAAPPYETVWSDAPLGVSQVVAVAYDVNGLSTTSSVAAVTVKSDLVLHYKFDEASGQVAADTAGLVGGAQNATNGLTPQWLPSGGVLGGALRFSAASQTSVAEAFVYDSPAPIITNFPLTMGGWVKASGGSTWARNFAFLGEGSAFDRYFQLSLNIAVPNGVGAGTRSSTSGGLIAANSPTNIAVADDQWHHVAATFSSASSRVLYVDGVAVATNTTTVDFPANNNRFAVGALMRSTPTDGYYGLVDDVGLWSSALAPERIALVHGLGRHAGLDLANVSLDLLLDLYNSHAGSTYVGTNLWSYTNGLPGVRGTTGTNQDGFIYIVLGTSGEGVVGGTPVPPPAQVGIIISEIMGANSTGLEDEDRERSDWLELYNGQLSTQSLAGWFLSDSETNLTKWAFPTNYSLSAYQYAVVFVSGKNKYENAYPHTSFKLKKEGGSVFLVGPDTNIVSQITYPAQVDDVSWGAVLNGTNLVYGYLGVATPNGVNSSIQATNPPAERPLFDRPSGVLLAVTNLEILAPLAPNTVIRYTTNGSEPTEASPLYTGPIPLGTTTIRARAFSPGHLPSIINNRHFILLGGDLQNFNGSGAPFSSTLPVLVMDSYGRNIDAENAVGTRPFRTTMAALYDLEAQGGRAAFSNAPAVAERGGVHIHGQTSSLFSQRPYRWEIWKDSQDDDKDVALLDMPADSDWILSGPYFEKSLMRNYLAYSWMQALHGSAGAPRARFVELFFNQDGGNVTYADYRGVYLLVEKIKRGKDRVNIEELTPSMTSTSLVSGGFIYKKDKEPRDNPFSTGSGVPLDIYEPQDPNGAQVAALRSFLNDFESVLTNASFADPAHGYRAFIEPETFIDIHLLVESTYQIDGYRNSTYYTLNRNGKIRALPIWDYDRSMGSAYNFNDGGTTGWYYQQTGAGTPWNVDYAWYPRLFQDPEFSLQYWDRYWQLRRSLLSLPTLTAQIDGIVARLTDGYQGAINSATPTSIQNPAARHFRRWNVLGQNIFPNSSGWNSRIDYQSEVRFLKTWLTNRLAWIDTQHSQPPVFNQYGGSVSSGFGLTMANPNGSGAIYYTLDGSDPRVAVTGAIVPGASTYTDPINLAASVQVRARILAGSSWSPISEGTFAVAATAASSNNLVISEFMYHPPAASAAEAALGYTAANDFEFVEFLNTSAGYVNLAGVAVTRGITFSFASNLPPSVLILPPGGRVVISGNPTAFTVRYGTNAAARIAGQYTGNLANSGERLTVLAADTSTIIDFTYSDGGAWPKLGDGYGFSIVLRSEAALQDFNSAAAWWQSSTLNGSPGAAAPTLAAVAPVWINEALTFGATPTDEFVELHNPNPTNVNIGGWFLTDDLGSPFKYRFTNETTLPAQGFLVLGETNYAPAFVLSHDGGKLWLIASDVNTNLSGFVHLFDYGTSAQGVSFGRYINSVTNEFVVAQSANTPGAANASPAVGPLVISEIHYHPADLGLTNNSRDEFIELLNITVAPVSLFDPALPTNTWRLRNAVDFDFPTNVTLAANQRLVIVGFNPATNLSAWAEFQAALGFDSNALVMGPWSGTLNNAGETIELKKPGVPGTNGVPYITVEAVAYDDATPWPAGADGLSGSLQRVRAGLFGNDPANWAAASPTPGAGPVSADTDGDGLPDSWELAFGTDPQTPDANADPDGDGVSNLAEYLAGTNPHDPASALRITATISGAALELQFLAPSNRVVTLQHADTAQPDAWLDLTNWPAAITNRTLLYSPATTNRQTFYRIRIP